jgi:hypothetical protein
MILSLDDHAKDHLTVTRPSPGPSPGLAVGSSDRYSWYSSGSSSPAFLSERATPEQDHARPADPYRAVLQSLTRVLSQGGSAGSISPAIRKCIRGLIARTAVGPFDHLLVVRWQIAPYIEHARRAGRGQRRRSARTSSSRERSGDIRAWAKDQGIGQPAWAHPGQRRRAVPSRHDSGLRRARITADRNRSSHRWRGP